jgi:hypothetical protein
MARSRGLGDVYKRQALFQLCGKYLNLPFYWIGQVLQLVDFQGETNYSSQIQDNRCQTKEGKVLRNGNKKGWGIVGGEISRGEG